MITNKEIRDLARVKNVPLWKIARAYGCNDSTFSRKLRNEFSKEEKAELKKIIISLAKESDNEK